MKTIASFIFLATLATICIADNPTSESSEPLAPKNVTENPQPNSGADNRYHYMGKGKRMGKNNRQQLQKKGARQAGKQQPTPKPCNLENFQALNECCKEQIGMLFKYESRVKCYITAGYFANKEAISGYVLNRWVNKTTGKLNLVRERDYRLEDMKCLLDCVFKAENLLVNNNSTISLNAEQITTYFKSSLDGKPESQALLNQAVTKCLSVAPALAINQQQFDSCNVLPFAFTQCVKGEVVSTCKLPTIPTDIPSRQKIGTYRFYAEMCQAHRKALERCKIF